MPSHLTIVIVFRYMTIAIHICTQRTKAECIHASINSICLCVLEYG